MGSILCPLPGAEEGVDLGGAGKEGGDLLAFPCVVVILWVKAEEAGPPEYHVGTAPHLPKTFWFPSN